MAPKYISAFVIQSVNNVTIQNRQCDIDNFSF